MRLTPFDQDAHWVLTPSIVLPPGFPGADQDIDIAHRANCDLVVGLAHFDPDIHTTGADEYKVGFSYLELTDDGPEMVYFTGEPFEILCQMFNANSKSWLYFEFCDYCVPQDGDTHHLEQFLSMLPNDDFIDCLETLFLELVESVEEISRLAEGLLVQESVKRLKANSDTDGTNFQIDGGPPW